MACKTKVGALTFALGRAYQQMALLQARSWSALGIPMTVVVSPTDGLIEGLTDVANVVEYLRPVTKAFEYEAYALDLSPYEVTIKTDADVWIPPCYELPQYVQKLSLVSGQPSTMWGLRIRSSPYRQAWSNLNLPEVYSAMFSFRKDSVSRTFFDTVKQVFANHYVSDLKKHERKPSTDFAYSVAWAALFGTDVGAGLPFVHMKPGLTGLDIPLNWTDHIPVLGNRDLYISGLRVVLPLHYYDKRFASCISG